MCDVLKVFNVKKLNKKSKTMEKPIGTIYDRINIFTYEDLLQSNLKI